MKRIICILLTFIFIVVRLQAQTVQPINLQIQGQQGRFTTVIELLESSGVLADVRAIEAQAAFRNPSCNITLAMLPEAGVAAGAAVSASVAWGAVAILAVCAFFCLGVSYASASEEERAIVEQWLKDKWELACEYYCSMGTYSRALLTYLGKLIDKQATSLYISMTDAVEAFPEIPEEDGWDAVRTQYTKQTDNKGLPLDFILIPVGEEMERVQGYEVKAAVHTLMSDLYKQLGRTNNAVDYNLGTAYSKKVKTLFETDEVLLPSTPINVWGDTPFGVKVLSSQRSYNYGWKMAYIDVQYHFVGKDGLDYYLGLTYNKKLSSSQAVSDTRVQTYGNLSYNDHESGYIVDLYKTEGKVTLGHWEMHVNNHLTDYASDQIKAQARAIVDSIARNTGITLDLSKTTNYLYVLDLAPFPDDFNLGTNGWVVTHNGYKIKDEALVYPAGFVKPSNVAGGLEGVTFRPAKTTTVPLIMTPDQIKDKYQPKVMVSPAVIPKVADVITDVALPMPTPTPSIKPVEDPDIDYEAATELDMEPLKVAGELFTTKFPFSLPFDLIALIELFNVQPVAPVIEVELKQFVPTDFKKYVNVMYRLDFSEYEVVIKLFRWFLLLSFVSGLIKITSALIKH